MVNQKVNAKSEMRCTIHCTNSFQFSPNNRDFTHYPHSILLKTLHPVF